ncbi:MAG: glycosyltransferase family 9 protein [Thermodesulfobacteriota bacterium]
MHQNDKVYLIHEGALGDFLLAWPAILSLARRLAGRELLWAGRAAYLPWVSPLGFSPCPPRVADLLQGLPASGPWPPDAPPGAVIRFGLLDRPGEDQPGRWRLAGVVPGRSPRDVYAEALAGRGVPFAPDWLATFQGLFGRAAAAGDRILLFPGGGHRLKHWPRVQFLELARRLSSRGLDPVFVLGPVELERGFAAEGVPVLAPPDLAALQQALLAARLALGNDCGPMHLAGMLGLPGAVLFGPTSARQWAPPGITAIRGRTGCRPCTLTTADLECPEADPAPPCLTGISLDTVWEAALRLLA